MNVNAQMLQEAQSLLDAASEVLARKEADVLNIGCSMCTNCSGIVGG